MQTVFLAHQLSNKQHLLKLDSFAHLIMFVLIVILQLDCSVSHFDQLDEQPIICHTTQSADVSVWLTDTPPDLVPPPRVSRVRIDDATSRTASIS